MNSFNHYAYGAIGDWMYRVVAGIQELEPGYKKIKIMPHPGGNLTHISADLQTYYGTISSHWKLNNGEMELNVTVPPNTQAIVYIPAKEVENIKESGKLLSLVKDAKVTGKQEGHVAVEVGSGKYQFITKK